MPAPAWQCLMETPHPSLRQGVQPELSWRCALLFQHQSQDLDVAETVVQAAGHWGQGHSGVFRRLCPSGRFPAVRLDGACPSSSASFLF